MQHSNRASGKCTHFPKHQSPLCFEAEQHSVWSLYGFRSAIELHLALGLEVTWICSDTDEFLLVLVPISGGWMDGFSEDWTLKLI